MPARLCRSEVSPVEQVNRIVKYRESVLNVKSYAIGVFRRLRHEHHCGFRNAVHVSAPNFSTINFLCHRRLMVEPSRCWVRHLQGPFPGRKRALPIASPVPHPQAIETAFQACGKDRRELCDLSACKALSHRILDTVASKPLLVSSHCRLTGSWHRYLRTRSTGIFRHPGGPAGASRAARRALGRDRLQQVKAICHCNSYSGSYRRQCGISLIVRTTLEVGRLLTVGSLFSFCTSSSYCASVCNGAFG